MESRHERINERDTMDYAWMADAECKGSTDLFYAPFGESKSKRLKREEAAKKICAFCMVRVECLDYARKNQEQSGIWGGETELERNKHVRMRRFRAS